MSANAPMGGFGAATSLRQHAAHCEARMKQGVNREELLRQMAEAGCPPAEAERIVAAVANKLRGSAMKILGFGILLFALGLFMTIATFAAAYAAGGGVFVLCFGAVISGVICVVIGIRSMVKLQRALR